MAVKIIGLTGGIGSGKTTIARYFRSLGVPVYVADDEAKNILSQPEAIKEITAAFGEKVLAGGLPDKKKLAALVFNDKEKLAMLNAIIHPRVNRHFREWAAGHSDKKFIIKEAAILFESGSYKDCDKVILVTAPQEVRIERVMERDKVSRAQVLDRMANQWDDAKKQELSNYIIENTNLDIAKKQAYDIFNELSLGE